MHRFRLLSVNKLVRTRDVPVDFQRRFRSRLPSRSALLDMPLRELQDLAKEHRVPTAGCFDKPSLAHRLALVSETQQNFSSSNRASGSGGAKPVQSQSVQELKALITRAGLSTEGLFEKHELVAQAVKAQSVLAAKAARSEAAGGQDGQRARAASQSGRDNVKKQPGSNTSDADAYCALDVLLFGRGSCPYCQEAVKTLRARGVSEVLLQDVEWSRDAMMEFRKYGGKGVPLFYSRKTGKSVEGWNQGQPTLDWLVRRLS